ncbi:MAG TPA: phenylalanine--tRNA ligase subunit beta, partial [Pyrinomonadaceae bacterium]|nr:phenylalanine--tRNA ligase subunit beta [Pyrinomonadaceae bacterium]
MNISYNWLKDLIDLDLSPDETAKALTRVGLAVEGVHPQGDDFVLDIDLTSNRPDCLSHRGVARELGVSLDRELKLAPVETELPMPAVLAGETVQILDPDLCHRFTARIIRGVKIGPSQQWLVGERSINNVADITNYVMHELGQPMHAFDHDKLAEKRIVVRRAKDGEKITSLDEAEHELNSSMVVVCDAERPQGIGGIIGGWDSRITDDTTNVLLEVAYFDRSSVRQTGRKLGITTEAGYRFERGADVDNIKRASDRATQLICELAGGEKGEFIDIYPKHVEKPTVHSADISAATKRLTGLDVKADECDRILHRLGIEKVSDREYSSPTWRHDIAIEEDLVEEVARHFGFENIATELPPAFGAGEYLRDEERMRRVRQTLAGLGFSEAMSYSFIDETNDGKFALAAQASGETSFVSLKHAVIEGSTRMRPTIIPGLLDALRLNMNFQRRNLKLYEIGKAFIGFGDGQLPSEPRLFTFALTGSERHSSIASDQRGLDFYDAKAVVEALAEELAIPIPEFRSSIAKH